MPKRFQSQWEFDDLFAYAKAKQVFTVSELTAKIRGLLEGQIGRVRVLGEISNLRCQNSGHWYFSLKDAGAQIACVLFRGDAFGQEDLLRMLKDGTEVIVEGELTVYEPRGQYQIVVRKLEPRGIGALQIAFERLKARLHAEGLFAAERKRPLPIPLLRIGLVTSPTGAAIRDFLQITGRRFPLLRIVLAPCRVQGETAALEIARAIQNLNRWSAAQPPSQQLQAIVVTRGGGSLEDLWAFNEEIVARAIFESELPVVSAVGHEIDFTISDFVADLRAPTPSSAAELVTEWGWIIRRSLEELPQMLTSRLAAALQQKRQTVAELKRRLDRAQPKRQLELRMQRMDELSDRLQRALRMHLRQQTLRVQVLRDRLARTAPDQRIQALTRELEQQSRLLQHHFQRQFEQIRARIQRARDRLRLLSPQHTLERGFSITVDAESGRILRSVQEVRSGATLRTYLAHGGLRSRVLDLEPKASPFPKEDLLTEPEESDSGE